MTEVLVEDRDGIRTVTLNRPERLNALTPTMRVQLKATLEEFDADDNLRVLVLTGAGRGFCSGADLRDEGTVEKRSRAELKSPRNWWQLAFDRTDKPLICALNGVAAGAGLGLAFACDIIIAAAGATLHPAFIKLGRTPDNGIALSLQRRVGYSRALMILVTGDPVTAEEAKKLGLVDEVCPDEELPTRVQALAQRIASGPSVAIDLTKRLLKDAATLDRRQLLAYEEVVSRLAGATEDAQEGLAAFRERRTPMFKGY